MKVLGICGSFREESNTNKIVKKVAESSGLDFELVYLGKMVVEPCTGCLSCMMSDGQCVVQDDMQELYEKIMDAESLIIGSPTYYMNISGAVKCFLDRKFALYFRGIGPEGSKYTGQRPLAGRPSVGVTTTAGGGHARSIETLRHHFQINMMNIVGELAEVVGMDDVRDMPEVMERAVEAGKKIAEALQQHQS